MTERIVYPPTETLRDRGVPPPDDTQATLDDAFDIRIASLTEWLEDHVPSSRAELAGLDPETQAQLFWHHG